MIEKVNLAQKFSLFHEHYQPKIAGAVNDSHVKLVKLKGEFVWHHHDEEDELFFVVHGALHMKIRESGGEHEMDILPGEFVIIPRGVEHCPSAIEEAHVMLLEPKSTVNTGSAGGGRTVRELQEI